MGFNEMTHAFLAARYYIRLTEQFGDRGPLSMGSSIMEARGAAAWPREPSGTESP
jgi:hypothetical protein